ncbi:glycosyl hydrolase [Nitrosococcus wardiae]|uniref:Glycosyl hydrolase n=1 Tax=Nitrosococcus wardiae TaxID=1814290 RepID=A0A4P7BWM4_9GAMM|nr:glycosyl hydrolase [Nitrosococcus wardiae]QBQ54483.1 glycosyl hydrolase [Nitrosococcus wardiae]
MAVLMAVMALWIIGGSLLLVFYYRHTLLTLWREPMLRRPVLIIESDDWGPGPAEHAEVLSRLIATLSSHRDCSGHPAVMTLGLVLSIPDTNRIRQVSAIEYHRRRIDHPQFAKILAAICEGEKLNVFSLQLHGMEHFWPPALLSAAGTDSTIKQWLTTEEFPNTEELPSPLQSRWIDAVGLPSTPLSEAAITAAVAEEIQAFSSIFGRLPQVVVPPTFIWNEMVEKQWTQAGVQIIVTPGRRLEHRDKTGKPVPIGPPLFNGMHSTSGAIYVIRNSYFEPQWGHTAQRALQKLEQNWQLARPTLFESHRFNFTGAAAEADQAFTELHRLLAQALKRYPDLLFMGTAQLMEQMLKQDPNLVENRLAGRVQIWLKRLAQTGRLYKLAWITGLALVAVPVFYLARFAMVTGSYAHSLNVAPQRDRER